jgi:threonine dehydratase
MPDRQPAGKMPPPSPAPSGAGAPPDLATLRATAERIAPYVVTTPVHALPGDALGRSESLPLKLELLQRTGSFKARGAVNNLLSLSPAERAAGVVAVSAGNHAVAVSYASHCLGVSAKVVMHENANPARVDRARRYGAEVILAKDIAEAFATTKRIEADEGRTFVHPFEGAATVAGQGTVGLEIAEQLPQLDAVVVAVGGGGLIAGVGSAIKALQPRCEVIGVEPEGADGMTQSLERGAPLAEVQVQTIADSVGAPLHTEGTFRVCQQVIDRTVRVDDDALCRAMALLFDELKLAVEPAGAASVAAVAGPLARSLEGRRACALLCGSNIDAETFAAQVARGHESRTVGRATTGD